MSKGRESSLLPCWLPPVIFAGATMMLRFRFTPLRGKTLAFAKEKAEFIERVSTSEQKKSENRLYLPEYLLNLSIEGIF